MAAGPHGCTRDDASWIAAEPPAPGTRYAAKTRYRQADAACTVIASDPAHGFALAFDAPQWAVTPGQSAVLYDGEVCLGGGVIASMVLATLESSQAD